MNKRKMYFINFCLHKPESRVKRRQKGQNHRKEEKIKSNKNQIHNLLSVSNTLRGTQKELMYQQRHERQQKKK